MTVTPELCSERIQENRPCVNGIQHNGRVAAFQIQVRTDILSIQINYIVCVIANNCDSAIGGSLVGGDKQPLKLQKFGDALQTFTMLNGIPESSRLML